MKRSHPEKSVYYTFDNPYDDTVRTFLSSGERKIDDINAIWLFNRKIVTFDSVDQYIKSIKKFERFVGCHKVDGRVIAADYSGKNRTDITRLFAPLYDRLIYAPDMSDPARMQFIDKVLKDRLCNFTEMVEQFLRQVSMRDATRASYEKQLNSLNSDSQSTDEDVLSQSDHGQTENVEPPEKKQVIGSELNRTPTAVSNLQRISLICMECIEELEEDEEDNNQKVEDTIGILFQ